MDSTKEAELLELTESQALGKLVGFGLRVEVEAFRGFVSATAYVIKSDPKSRKQRYDSEFFARVTELEYCHGEEWTVADGYSSIIRHLLLAVIDKKEAQKMKHSKTRKQRENKNGRSKKAAELRKMKEDGRA